MYFFVIARKGHCNKTYCKEKHYKNISYKEMNDIARKYIQGKENASTYKEKQLNERHCKERLFQGQDIKRKGNCNERHFKEIYCKERSLLGQDNERKRNCSKIHCKERIPCKKQEILHTYCNAVPFNIISLQYTALQCPLAYIMMFDT